MNKLFKAAAAFAVSAALLIPQSAITYAVPAAADAAQTGTADTVPGETAPSTDPEQRYCHR